MAKVTLNRNWHAVAALLVAMTGSTSASGSEPDVNHDPGRAAARQAITYLTGEVEIGRASWRASV